MAYTAPTQVAGTTLISQALWESDHYNNWAWLSSFTLGGKALSEHTLPVSLGAQLWQLTYEPGADFASISFDLSGLATRFRTVRIVGANLRTDYASWADNVLLSFGNDKANTYYHSFYRALRATPTNQQILAAQPGIVLAYGAAGATAAASCYGNFEVTIYQPRKADFPYVSFRTWLVNTTTNQIVHGRGGGHYYQAGVVDRFDLDPQVGNNFLSGGVGEPTTRIDVTGYYGVED